MNKPDGLRQIFSHKGPGTSELNNSINIIADQRDENGGSHEYDIGVVVNGENVAGSSIYFQNGPVLEAGLNGISDEALIAIVIDRLEGFQEGPTPGGRGKFSSRYNSLAITKLEEALLWLQKRTRDRAARGVEGTHNA